MQFEKTPCPHCNQDIKINSNVYHQNGDIITTACPECERTIIGKAVLSLIWNYLELTKAPNTRKYNWAYADSSSKYAWRQPNGKAYWSNVLPRVENNNWAHYDVNQLTIEIPPTAILFQGPWDESLEERPIANEP